MLDVRDGVLAFRHELVRQAVEESLPGGRRIQLNRAVLTALLDAEAPDRARILHHADRCRDVDAVLAHGPAAARAAAADGARQQALAYREQVRPFADRLAEAERGAFFAELAWEYYSPTASPTRWTRRARPSASAKTRTPSSRSLASST